jgi:protein TonB
MFEDAMMESSGRINTRSKYYTLFGALLNGGLLAGLILFPLLHPGNSHSCSDYLEDWNH